MKRSLVRALKHPFRRTKIEERSGVRKASEILTYFLKRPTFGRGGGDYCKSANVSFVDSSLHVMQTRVLYIHSFFLFLQALSDLGGDLLI